MKHIDPICVGIFNQLCKCISFTCCPLKWLCFKLSESFERPYSMILCLDYIILILPGILLLATLLQFFNIIYSNGLIMFYLCTIAFICFNYIFTFIIYEAYQEHFIQNSKPKYSIRVFLKDLYAYTLKHKCLFLISFTLLGEVIITLILLHEIKKYKELSSLIGYPILIDVLYYGIYANFIFSFGHVIIYFLLFLLLLCTINNSCLCSFCTKGIYLVKEIDYKRLSLFIQILLSSFYILGLFDYKTMFACEDENDDNEIEGEDPNVPEGV